MSIGELEMRRSSGAAPIEQDAAGSTQVLLLLLALVETADPWALADSGTIALGRAVGAADLDLLHGTGIVVRRAGRLTLRDRAAVPAMLENVSPTQLGTLHEAWGEVLADDPLGRAAHQAMAHPGSDPATARQAASTAVGLADAGRMDQAVAVMREAARLAVGAERAAYAVRAAALAFVQGKADLGADLLSRSEQSAADADLAVVRDALEAAFGSSSMRSDLRWCDAIAAAGRPLRDWGLSAAALSVLATVPSYRWRRTDAAVFDATIGLRGGEQGRADRRPGEAGLQALTMLRSGRVSTALSLMRDEAHRLGLAGLDGTATHVYVLVGEAAARIGDLSLAAHALALAHERAQVTDQPAWRRRGLLTAALVANRRSQPLTADMSSCVRGATHSVDAGERAAAALVDATELVARQRWSEAFDILDGLVTGASSPGSTILADGVLGLYADAAAHVGRVARAREAISTLAELQDYDDDVSLGELLFATAVLADVVHADACFEVLLAHDRDRWPWLSARAHLAFGTHLRRTRRVARARAHLQAAYRVFASLEAVSWVGRASGELRAAGVRGDAAEVGFQDLSPQEQEIVQMAAQGLSNREIGEALYLSSRTIGSHLYRIFPKLNVTSRMQLAQVVRAAAHPVA